MIVCDTSGLQDPRRPTSLVIVQERDKSREIYPSGGFRLAKWVISILPNSVHGNRQVEI